MNLLSDETFCTQSQIMVEKHPETFTPKNDECSGITMLTPIQYCDCGYQVKAVHTSAQSYALDEDLKLNEVKNALLKPTSCRNRLSGIRYTYFLSQDYSIKCLSENLRICKFIGSYMHTGHTASLWNCMNTG